MPKKNNPPELEVTFRFAAEMHLTGDGQPARWASISARKGDTAWTARREIASLAGDVPPILDEIARHMTRAEMAGEKPYFPTIKEKVEEAKSKKEPPQSSPDPEPVEEVAAVTVADDPVTKVDDAAYTVAIYEPLPETKSKAKEPVAKPAGQTQLSLFEA